MPLAAIRVYLERLPELQAELMRMLVDATSFPHMTAEGQRAVAERWTPRQGMGDGGGGPQAPPAADRRRHDAARLMLIGIGLRSAHLVQ
jgi:hypothetical protein